MTTPSTPTPSARSSSPAEADSASLQSAPYRTPAPAPGPTGQKTATSPLRDAPTGTPSLGEEGGSGLLLTPEPKPTPAQRGKSALAIFLGVVVGMICLFALSRSQPILYVLALIVAVVSIPLLSGMSGKRMRQN